ncbi:aminopeptidase [Pseudomonas sp. N040]|uniref:aminopeptidase n=1 Tax=Pseudomonas sp. N040 TaxID=2785325 RepID=UPI0018A2D385|nr:aminopeptidase [Pseudomonas sp. N040]MBF7728841.1 aminopeptidase [Pseudomonas sp. N040]MBW7012481.1 aminopeptidase [Pseudomonas sp. N040]
MNNKYRPRIAAGLRQIRQKLAALAVGGLLAGCSTVDYYVQVSRGHLQLMQQREPIEQVLADPARDALLRQRLVLALQARSFASSALALPDNQSYRVFADIQRPVVLWNVYVTAEFSLSAEEQCFPFAGCVAYRGYYEQSRARGAAAVQQLAGKDVWIGGVEAYSTLGWFDDPLLSSMLLRDDQHVAAVIFHELAHQQLYVGDDSAFNESFASFVEQEGLRQWLASRGEAPGNPWQACRRQQLTTLVLDTRARLERVYASGQPAARMRLAKQAEFERLRAEYRQLRDTRWQGDGRYDAWIDGPLNNAKLLPFGLYEQWVPAFAELFERSGRRWPAFYTAVERLAEQPPAARQQRLHELLAAHRSNRAAGLNCATGRH